MVSALISRLIILVFGTLYPAYASYKAVRTKNVKEYVKWMMYWIVFALFTCAETFADVLLSWAPFYYEIKIIFLLWMLSPATRGSSILYRQFVHPELMKREEHIDQYIDKVKSQGYTALLRYGTQGLNLAVQTALTGQSRLVDQLKKSYSLNDLSQTDDRAQVFVPPPRIPEDTDETDFPVQKEQYQRGEVYEGDIPSREMDNRRNEMMQSAGYSIDDRLQAPEQEYMRTQEYHGVTDSGRATRSTSRRVTYNHEESLHYGTLPRRRSARTTTSRAMPPGWK